MLFLPAGAAPPEKNGAITGIQSHRTYTYECWPTISRIAVLLCTQEPFPVSSHHGTHSTQQCHLRKHCVRREGERGGEGGEDITSQTHHTRVTLVLGPIHLLQRLCLLSHILVLQILTRGSKPKTEHASYKL